MANGLAVAADRSNVLRFEFLLFALLRGLSGKFHPEVLGLTASTALAAVIIELVALKLGCYLLSISNSQLLDLVAYSGYKFVGITVSILFTALMGKGWISWLVFAYAYLANAFFLLRSLKYVAGCGGRGGVGRWDGGVGASQRADALCSG